LSLIITGRAVIGRTELGGGALQTAPAYDSLPVVGLAVVGTTDFVTPVAGTTINKTASDTLNVVASESEVSSSIGISFPTSLPEAWISSSQSATSILAFLSRIDTNVIAIAETDTIKAVVSVVDAIAVVTPEISTPTVKCSRADIIAAAFSEISNISTSATSIHTNDTIAVATTENQATLVRLSRSDALVVAAAESKNLSISVNTSDITTLAISDVNALTAKLSRTDTTALSISENRALVTLLSRSDALVVAALDSKAIKVSLSRTDTTAVAITDTGIAAKTLMVVSSDTTAFAISDASTLTAKLSRTDTAVLSVSESKTTAVSLSRADISAIVISDSKTIKASLSRVDQTNVAVVDASAPKALLLVNDIANVAVSESNTLLGVKLSRADGVNIWLGVLSIPHLTPERAAILAKVQTSNQIDIAAVDISHPKAIVGVNDQCGLIISSIPAAVTAAFPADDALAITITEQKFDIPVTLHINESLNLVLDTSTAQFVTLSDADLINTAIIDAPTVLALLNVDDVTALLFSETSKWVMPFYAVDSLNLILTDPASIRYPNYIAGQSAVWME